MLIGSPFLDGVEVTPNFWQERFLAIKTRSSKDQEMIYLAEKKKKKSGELGNHALSVSLPYTNVHAVNDLSHRAISGNFNLILNNIKEIFFTQMINETSF